MNKQHLTIPHRKITAFCQRWKVAEFSLFGSVLRDDFHPDSDVDVLVTFTPGSRVSLFDLVKMEDELKGLFGRDVDLVERRAIERSENYIRRKGILSNTKVIYAEG